LQWSQTLGIGGIDALRSVFVVPSGAVAVGYSVQGANQTGWIVKISADGALFCEPKK
jgi:hypothetical protein